MNITIRMNASRDDVALQVGDEPVRTFDRSNLSKSERRTFNNMVAGTWRKLHEAKS